MKEAIQKVLRKFVAIFPSLIRIFMMLKVEIKRKNSNKEEEDEE